MWFFTLHVFYKINLVLMSTKIIIFIKWHKKVSVNNCISFKNILKPTNAQHEFLHFIIKRLLWQNYCFQVQNYLFWSHFNTHGLVVLGKKPCTVYTICLFDTLSWGLKMIRHIYIYKLSITYKMSQHCNVFFKRYFGVT